MGHLAGLLQRRTGASSIADLLAPSFHQGEIALISECTEEELERARQVASSFVARFQIVRVEEPSAKDTAQLLDAWLSRHKGAPKVHPEVLARLVRYLRAFTPGSAFPGKGVRFLEWLVGQELEPRRHSCHGTRRLLCP